MRRTRSQQEDSKRKGGRLEKIKPAHMIEPMQHLVGGYYLVEGDTIAWETGPPTLPSPFWSVSDCLCRIYPGSWALPWVTNPGGQLEEHKARLALPAETFVEMRGWVDQLMQAGQFGWPNVWLDPSSAREYRRRYLPALPKVKLLEIALPERYAGKLIDWYRPEQGMEGVGVYQLLARQIRADLSLPRRGYEVLGSEFGGGFHSFICNNLEQAYLADLGIGLNQHGLIESLEQAAAASDYSNLETTGAEPVPWAPWLILEHPLD